ncbi:fatty acid--CoA ligase family protein [Paenibacillus sp. N3.4]|uniref:ANL family adenylate-forming protein n=1 Tax=Paenibacillus sp. N3.4 TaxID=2603222 RepID=UPI0011C7F9EE|nr:fatty acid--CoA ligase family protein [Paenibacillus sp. N3.4]TXK84579.1 long-chain fatty acid--CoA ligase [Paenibacillus sp. N3.4]
MAIGWLLDKISEFANQESMVFAGNSVTFGRLLDDYINWSSIIKNRQICSGEVILLEGDYSPAVSGAILALIANGNVIVPISASVRHRLQELNDIAQVNRSIHFEGDSYRIENYERSAHTGLLEQFLLKGQAGMILFTSGTTGAPKAILHDISQLIERYKVSRDTLRTLSFLLFDHIGGINTLFHTLANGGTIIVPPSRSPSEICALIEKHRVELLPTSPSFLNMLLMTEAYKQFDMSSLHMITYGTEVMPDYTLQQLRSQFPHIELRQTYGLSELGILRAKSKDSGSPWLKIGGEGIETKIVDGVLHIRSKTAMVGYLNAPNPFDEEGWFNTQDQVSVDGEYLRIFGRCSEIINVGGRKVYPVEVEDVLLQMDEVRDVTVKGEPSSLLGHVVCAVVNTDHLIDAKELKQRVRIFCQGKLEDYQVPVKVYIQEKELFSERYKKLRKA